MVFVLKISSMFRCNAQWVELKSHKSWRCRRLWFDQRKMGSEGQTCFNWDKQRTVSVNAQVCWLNPHLMLYSTGTGYTKHSPALRLLSLLFFLTKHLEMGRSFVECFGAPKECSLALFNNDSPTKDIFNNHLFGGTPSPKDEVFLSLELYDDIVWTSEQWHALVLGSSPEAYQIYDFLLATFVTEPQYSEIPCG